MVFLIYGGSGSGKSEYAEKILMGLPSATKYYLATMKVYGQEGSARVERHRKLREGKGFVTIECPVDVDKVEFESESAAVILECLSNLTANEMFINDKPDFIQVPEREVVFKVLKELKQLSRKAEHLVIVSNNIFEDGIEYDESSKCYLRALAAVNAEVADFADKVVEVVAGIPIEI